MYFTISIEVQIVLAICLFYGYDSALGLQAHEGLLRSGRKRWHGLLALSGFELRGTWLLWPPILLPHQPVYRMPWDATRLALNGGLNGNSSTVQALAAHAQSFRAFVLPIYLLAICLFALLPLALLHWHSEAAQLLALLLIYIFTVWLSALAWRHGKQGHSDAAQARSIALQILLCPPFALNVVRKLSLSFSASPAQLLQAGKQLMQPVDWQALAQQASKAITEEMQEIADLPELAPRHQALEKSLELLQAQLQEIPNNIGI